jgi:hypothetical protein
MTDKQIDAARKFAEYLLTLAADLDESGSEFSAKDTRRSALLIANLCDALSLERLARKRKKAD